MIRLQRMWPDYLANSSILLRLKNMCLSFFLQRPKFPPRNSYKQARTDPHRKNGSNPFFKDLLKHTEMHCPQLALIEKSPFPSVFFLLPLNFGGRDVRATGMNWEQICFGNGLQKLKLIQTTKKSSEGICWGMMLFPLFEFKLVTLLVRI